MKDYILSFLIENETESRYSDVEVFDNFKEAKKAFKRRVKNQPRFRESDESDFKEYLSESVVLDLWIDGDFEETLMQQVIYSEGQIDRNNYKGDYASWYYSRATFNGKELMHTMYFLGEKQMWGKRHKVPNSKLKEWYYK